MEIRSMTHLSVSLFPSHMPLLLLPALFSSPLEYFDMSDSHQNNVLRMFLIGLDKKKKKR